LIRPPDIEPERGEIVLLDLDADGEADLTGIVTDTAEMLHFVEGDLGHALPDFIRKMLKPLGRWQSSQSKYALCCLAQANYLGKEVF
ncbi:MAG: hypothetical protein IIY89_07410, partial [Clostridia bacterium]|nr:hypothetical protein [Clostridia bacterium]